MWEHPVTSNCGDSYCKKFSILLTDLSYSVQSVCRQVPTILS